ncbi:AMP-binding enzyme family protein [Pseudooceanicola batsensis HTCC2597]|uniref:3-methylmercaptopropionyl-CoA ligase n=1 Tax=Pseudooceanicola batsensis (strain ATCC BAA-863 / DSM 15984 / KCTC 12145 / HTCC2597) TaxID=252305 RepID=A3U1D1_PSEBH|nr:long-chain-fatty-acid--CoA ligase [Pseudooceanicola batsensis]EAQ02114.1 AMP-binding enzyme family protein [Pseudooceanicola batsensis HTCC2597]
MLLNQSFRRAAQVFGKRTATIDGAGIQTWSEVAGRVERLAGALAAQGVSEGDRVALLAHNSARFFEAVFSTLWIGAVSVPLNTRWSQAELAYGLEDSEPKVIFVDDEFLEVTLKLRDEVAPNLVVIRLTGEGSTGPAVHDLEALVAANDPAEPAYGPVQSLAMICYTGGTTGQSKGVMLSHLALWSSALGFGADVRDLVHESSTSLLVMPLFHVGGLLSLFAMTLGAGCCVFMRAFDPLEVMQTIESRGVTHLILVPTMIRMIIDRKDLEDYDLSSIKVLSYGASPMTEGQIAETLEKLPGVNLQQSYGQTELSPYISKLAMEQHVSDANGEARLTSVGHAGIMAEVIIADDDLREMPRREVGEILVRGPHTMTGYWRKPDETAATLVNGWVRTGDVGWMDEEGFIYIVDRKKDMIVTGGENVYSSEVENALSAHPAVAIAVVIGIPDDRWGEAVHAIIVCRDERTATEKELIEHCRSRIAGYKCPRSVEFRSDALPLSAAGKILKRDLRAPYWARS